MEELLLKPDVFEPVPANWYLILADIENSTQAVKDGMHHQVNLAATGSIIAILNMLKTK